MRPCKVEEHTIGRIHSIQSLGTVDGPGVRFVAFLQGCHLRCGCCHNPDTWNMTDGKEISAQELARRALRYREYFGKEGGVTLSGGEPLLQATFAKDFFTLCREAGLNTCLDTSGSLWSKEISDLLEVTDRVLLDIKYTDEASYQAHVGCSLLPVLHFLQQLDERGIPTTLRQVIIPTINNTPESVLRLKELAQRHTCVDKVELLPFKKICTVKYEQLSIPFPFAHIPQPTREEMDGLESLFK